MLTINFYSPVNRKTEARHGAHIYNPSTRQEDHPCLHSESKASQDNRLGLYFNKQPTNQNTKQREYAPGRAGFKIPAQEIGSQ